MQTSCTYHMLAVQTRLGRASCAGHELLRFFYFYIFYFRFLQKYIFDLEIYKNIPRPPRCRAAGTWTTGRGAAGAFLKKIRRKNCAQVPGGRSPGSGAAGHNFCNLALFAKEFHICALL